MLTNRRDVRIVWGDCDPAGIVYYPRYFEMFDTSTTALFERALGMTKYEFVKAYDTVGYPMVDTRARFLLPTRYGDDVVIETEITEIKRSSFSLQGRSIAGLTLDHSCSRPLAKFCNSLGTAACLASPIHSRSLPESRSRRIVEHCRARSMLWLRDGDC